MWLREQHLATFGCSSLHLLFMQGWEICEHSIRLWEMLAARCAAEVVCSS